MSYEKSLSILADLENEVSTVGRRLGINIDRRVVRETPRDTGTAKASWLVSVNRPDLSTVERDGDVGAAESEAIANGAQNASKFKSGDTMYIQNNQPYIVPLNEGSSEQAPSGYIDAIIAQEVNRAD